MQSVFKKSLLVASFLAVSGLALGQSQTKTYLIRNHEDGTTGVSFKIGFTLGTHRGLAQEVAGEAVIGSDLNQLSLQSAKFSVPVRSLKTGNDIRDCHMNEALGLDYAVSNFPNDHVCDGAELPKTGPDSVVFTDIVFDLKEAKVTSENKSLAAGKSVTLDTSGTWTMHGITLSKPLQITLTVEDAGVIRLNGQIDFSLNEYKVVVIPWAGIISVKDKASVNLDLTFVPK